MVPFLWEFTSEEEVITLDYRLYTIKYNTGIFMEC